MRFQKGSGKFVNGWLIMIICATLLVLPASAITLTPGGSSSSTNVISNGDPVYVTGIATGHPRDGLQVWLIGYNTVRITTVAVNADNTYTYELKSTDTQNLASGQYLVIIQHPMMNGQFDIIYSPSTGQVINRQLGSSGTAIFQLTNGGSLQSTDAASALMRAINSQNIDDTFATASFYISPPQALISPIKDHAVGDKFTISGTTNLAAGDKLQVDVYSSSFTPTKKSQSGEYSGASGVVEVQAGSNGRNRWSFDIDASAFKPDEYIVKVAGITQDVTASTTFNILQSLPAATHLPTTTVTTQPAVPQSSVPATTAPVPVTTTKGSALPVWAGSVALLAVFAFLKLKEKK